MRTRKRDQRTIQDVEREWALRERMRKKPGWIKRCWRYFLDSLFANLEQLCDHLTTNAAFYVMNSVYAIIMFVIFLTVACLLMRNLPHHTGVPAHMQEAIQEH